MSLTKRWSGLLVGLAVATSALTAVTASPAAADLPEARCGTGAAIQGVEADGRLFEFLHFGAATGTRDWFPKEYIGTGWNGTLLYNWWGDYYLIPEGTGELRHYARNRGQWNTINGAPYEVLGTGFDRYTVDGATLTLDASGKLYGIDDTGELRVWIRTDNGWENGAGEVIGTGWDSFERVVAGAEGELFAFEHDGSALRYQYQYDTGEWTVQADNIDEGWGDFTNVLYAGAGVFYAVDRAGTLYWYRYANGEWANNGIGRQIGEGWKNLTLAVSPNTCSAA
ncbi:tachylectin-related carbohydrate-binding protein [Actinokineospora diospyrosa]|uniref:Tachylectin n=1 Tax=Actinokineospora diospyrosa TaxID=103728 RepID=A0ABT1IJD0_9PSEU|nr:tachylectin-related carbohydrate-binding protein [Actinokineospora diospyrosa]MCP2272750.1 Tachylectin [Actinokineospora diospyrosa]